MHAPESGGGDASPVAVRARALAAGGRAAATHVEAGEALLDASARVDLVGVGDQTRGSPDCLDVVGRRVARAQGDPRGQRARVRLACALTTGAGVPAGSPPRSASGSLPWPAPVPTPRGCRSRAGRCPSWRRTWANRRSVSSRPPSWAGCWSRPSSLSSAPDPGRPRRTPATSAKRPVCCRSTSGPTRTRR
jgi:hypothetical protein